MKKVISSSNAPSAIGPYSQGIAVGSMIFTSGQLPIDPATGEFAPGGISGQTRQALKNLEAVLNEAGSCLDKVVKTTVYLSDMNNFAEMNRVYAEIFGDGNYPARSAVEVARLPKDSLVEVEAVAYI